MNKATKIWKRRKGTNLACIFGAGNRPVVAIGSYHTFFAAWPPHCINRNSWGKKWVSCKNFLLMLGNINLRFIITTEFENMPFNAPSNTQEVPYLAKRRKVKAVPNASEVWKPKSDIMTSPSPVSEHLQCIRIIWLSWALFNLTFDSVTQGGVAYKSGGVSYKSKKLQNVWWIQH